jgi:hypothetical protein
MSNRNDEIERIQRIREQQIRARDPRAHAKKTQQKVRARYKKEEFSFQDMLSNLPSKWWGMFIGGIAGVILAIVFSQAVETEASWVGYVGYLIVFAGIVLGRGVGAAVDWSEEDHEKLVK